MIVKLRNSFNEMDALKKIIASFWVIVIYLFSGSAYQTIFSITNYLLIIGVVCAIFLVFRFYKVLLYKHLIFISLLFMTLITMIFNGELFLNFYLRFISVLIISFYLGTTYSFKEIKSVFVNFMFIVTVISLIGFFLVNNTTLLNFLPRFSNINDKEYAIGVIFNYMPVIPERNCAIFWEPGIFATYLVLAIIFELIYNSKKYHIIKLVVFYIGLLTANSTAGFLLGFITLLFMFYSKVKHKKQNVIMNIVSMFFLILLLLVILNLDVIILNSSLANNKYITKLLSDEFINSARMKAFVGNLKLFFDNPIFGVGISSYELSVIPFADISTLTYSLAVFGILGLMISGGFFIGIVKQKRLTIFQKIIFIAVLFSILSKEPHLEMLFSWLIFFSLNNNKYATGEIEGNLYDK
ncbi:MAG: hypothetical protein IJB21_07305 [Bacilli bacterium]|nr:hypothetical protein [Bacilli bacterium]